MTITLNFGPAIGAEKPLSVKNRSKVVGAPETPDQPNLVQATTKTQLTGQQDAKRRTKRVSKNRHPPPNQPAGKRE
jgi:hypothetical protein